MAPPRRYTDEMIIDALSVAPSVKAASELMGMSLGALRKRCERTHSASVRSTYEKCRQRGISIIGRSRPEGW